MADPTNATLNDVYVALCLILANQIQERDGGANAKSQTDAIHDATMEIMSLRGEVLRLLENVRNR